MCNSNYARVKMADWFPEQAESDLKYLVDQKNSDRIINNHCKISLFVSVLQTNIINCRSLRQRQVIDLLATDK